MKKFLSLAVLSLILMGCASVPEKTYVPEAGEITKFEGKWFRNAANIGFSEYSVTFTGNEFSFRETRINPQQQGRALKGTFYYTNKEIIFLVPDDPQYSE
jgi:hypothetical protein